jgi:hypothetical protein
MSLARLCRSKLIANFAPPGTQRRDRPQTSRGQRSAAPRGILEIPSWLPHPLASAFTGRRCCCVVAIAPLLQAFDSYLIATQPNIMPFKKPVVAIQPQTMILDPLAQLAADKDHSDQSR